MDELDGRNFIDAFGGRSLKSALMRVPPALFAMPLDDLERRANPTEVDQFIKDKFWELALSLPIRFRKKYRVSELHTDICTYTHLWANILQNPTKFAWILRQKHEKSVRFNMLNDRAFSMMRDFLENTPKDKDGHLTAAGMNALIRCLELLWKFVHPNAG